MGGIYGEICTKKGIYQRKWRLCGIILHGVLPLQGIRPDLYQVLVTVDGRTLKIVLLKMQGYSTKEIAPLVHLTTGAIYARLDHLRKKLRKIL